jgi:hypothetical protein
MSNVLVTFASNILTDPSLLPVPHPEQTEGVQLVQLDSADRIGMVELSTQAADLDLATVG